LKLNVQILKFALLTDHGRGDAKRGIFAGKGMTGNTGNLQRGSGS